MPPQGTKKRKCPICGTATVPAYAPFCSNRCRGLDLARWLDGDYRIPVVEEDAGIDEEVAEEDVFPPTVN